MRTTAPLCLHPREARNPATGGTCSMEDGWRGNEGVGHDLIEAEATRCALVNAVS